MNSLILRDWPLEDPLTVEVTEWDGGPEYCSLDGSCWKFVYCSRSEWYGQWNMVGIGFTETAEEYFPYELDCRVLWFLGAAEANRRALERLVQP